MEIPRQTGVRISVACGGTGGHLFPGIAVAEELLAEGCDVTLLISTKEVDQQAVQGAKGLQIVTLPASGNIPGRRTAFLAGFWRSFRISRRLFRNQLPSAVLAMGGFTSAPPMLAARTLGVPLFLHESNSIPGRANRWLSWIVRESFIAFPSARKGLHNRQIEITGTPVRSKFCCRNADESRKALGFDPRKPVVLVVGGSQGAKGINELVMRALPLVAADASELQWFHIAGPAEQPKVQARYRELNVPATVVPFFHSMELPMTAATICISRAGASSLAELAAVRLPSILVPYPAATDNHQYYNAKAFVDTGAAILFEQSSGGQDSFAEILLGLYRDSERRARVAAALAAWHTPQAAQRIAGRILERAIAAGASVDDPASSTATLRRRNSVLA